jgi:hypothetical protein
MSDYPFKDRDSKHTKKLMEESEFSVKIISADPNHEITIVIYSKVNKCLFANGRCPRPYKGRFYVKKVGMDYDKAGWTNSY